MYGGGGVGVGESVGGKIKNKKKKEKRKKLNNHFSVLLFQYKNKYTFFSFSPLSHKKRKLFS